ncbi:MAG: YgiQ family radical SAM protein [Desulfobacterales bacterium]|nr:YgiQ family radical SAM protein [Desulfobacterales bacterium]MDD4391791.1 YgiQ family radical SAM protein [Desulfobacterales bacterium]
MFIPTTVPEMRRLGWDALDIILVTGDSYIDSPHVGVSVIGKVLLKAGYRVGIIAQPQMDSNTDIGRLGEPRLFWGISGGCVDSMVSNYTALKKWRKSDDFTPGGVNNRRPDRAVIAYSNLIRRCFKSTCPIVLGGIEASLRRIAHYDFWSDSIRRSILFDAKADVLVYGMAERSIVELAEHLKLKKDIRDIRGLCYISKEKRSGYLELSSYTAVAADKKAFTDMFHAFYQNGDPVTATGLCQQQDTRYLIQNPPQPYPAQHELDEIYDLEFERNHHPFYQKMGDVRALETIRFSISTHRGCYGECNFCAIAVHEGRTIRWRSEDSIAREAQRLSQHPDFKGIIQDAGGPTANMYGFECPKKLKHGSCRQKRCLFPEICPQLPVDHRPQIRLLKRLRQISGIKKVFVSSGIRYDLILADTASGEKYLKQIIDHHVSGQMKVAPEHSEDPVLKAMGKPGTASLVKFKDLFYHLTRAAGKKQFLTYYLIAAHPGCREQDMKKLNAFAVHTLKIHPEQIQIFTPTPSTYSSLMYYTERDPFTGAPVYVEKNPRRKEQQKRIMFENKGARER